MLDPRAAVEAHARNAQHGELDHQDIALLAGGIVAGRANDGSHCAVRKGLGVELRCVRRGAVVPEADRVLAGHARLPLVSGDSRRLAELLGNWRFW
ncbi:hypothetical protein D3C81_1597760 [compost metagenome]